ncbi:nuclear transport factor 2 family protein [Streptomyces sp. AB3(2024)]|uniref:nuclear transport factor 2 family protein n=1 Tax=Streptomyces sp. AB3(2024) TaxID=3317321 RepID=UPI0035A385B8
MGLPETDVYRQLSVATGSKPVFIAGQVAYMGAPAPDVHRELHRCHVMGDIVAVELTIQGTFTGPFETPAGVVQPTGARSDIPTADFWYVEGGRAQELNCYVGLSVMPARLGVPPDFAAAVNAAAAAAS